jgi:hypothetical protein
MQQGTETEMVSVPEVQQQVNRTSLSDVAQILQNKLSHSEAQDEEGEEEEEAADEEQLEDPLLRATSSNVLALVDEYPVCNFNEVVPVECVDYDGTNFTLRLVSAIGEMVNWRTNALKKTPDDLLSFARAGLHPFAPGRVKPWDPLNGNVPYAPLETDALDFYLFCDKIIEWARRACGIPYTFWVGVQAKSDHEIERGTQKTRCLAVYKAVRAVYKVDKLQYADALYCEKTPDTFYVPQYFFFAKATMLSAAVLARMEGFGFGILHLLPEQIKKASDKLLGWVPY